MLDQILNAFFFDYDSPDLGFLDFLSVEMDCEVIKRSLHRFLLEMVQNIKDRLTNFTLKTVFTGVINTFLLIYHHLAMMMIPAIMLILKCISTILSMLYTYKYSF
jgi:hypothetical protein